MPLEETSFTISTAKASGNPDLGGAAKARLP